MPEDPGPLVYGTILVAALLAAEGTSRETYPRTVGAMLVGLALYWLAISYARDIGHRAGAGEHFSGAGYRREAVRELPVVLGGLGPLVVVLVCWATGARLSTAISAAVWAAAAIIVAIEIALGVRSRLEGADLVAQTAFGVLFGVGILALRVLLH